MASMTARRTRSPEAAVRLRERPQGVRPRGRAMHCRMGVRVHAVQKMTGAAPRPKGALSCLRVEPARCRRGKTTNARIGVNRPGKGTPDRLLIGTPLSGYPGSAQEWPARGAQCLVRATERRAWGGPCEPTGVTRGGVWEGLSGMEGLPGKGKGPVPAYRCSTPLYRTPGPRPSSFRKVIPAASSALLIASTLFGCGRRPPRSNSRTVARETLAASASSPWVHPSIALAPRTCVAEIKHFVKP